MPSTTVKGAPTCSIDGASARQNARCPRTRISRSASHASPKARTASSDPRSDIRSPMPEERPERRANSYLLDARFQLKWTSYLVGVVLLVMTALGFVIAQAAGAAADSASLAVAQAEKATQESKTSSKITRESIEAARPNDPNVMQIFDESLAEVDKKADDNLAEVQRRRAEIERSKKDIRTLLLGSG